MVATMGDVGRRSSGVGGPFQKPMLLSAPVALITLAAPDHMARSASHRPYGYGGAAVVRPAAYGVRCYYRAGVRVCR